MILVPTNNGFVVGGVASLLEEGRTLNAWAERLVREDPDLRWILGNYVEANRPNSNGHIFPLEDLKAAQASLEGKPLNMMHREHYIVGYFAGCELVGERAPEPAPPATASTISTYTINTTSTNSNIAFSANEDEQPPYVEALAAIWHNRFPEEMFNIRRAHKEGSLFYSMETIPSEVSCPSCDHRTAYAGFESETYCEHMQGSTAPKRLHNPVFSGGAIIIPPVKPGWGRADIKAISKFVEEGYMDRDALRADLENEAPHLGTDDWEALMAHLVAAARALDARDFSPDMRKKMADQGTAMPDGSYPIKSRQDVKNAIQAIGRAPASKRAAVKAHIRKRAKALGCEDLIPEGW